MSDGDGDLAPRELHELKFYLAPNAQETFAQDSCAMGLAHFQTSSDSILVH